MTAKEQYQYDINNLLNMDGTGLVSSFVLQLEDMLSTIEFNNEQLKLVDEIVRFLYQTTEGNPSSNVIEGW